MPMQIRHRVHVKAYGISCQRSPGACVVELLPFSFNSCF